MWMTYTPDGKYDITNMLAVWCILYYRIYYSLKPK